MPCVTSIGTYLPCWGSPLHRVPGDDEDAVKRAVLVSRSNIAGPTPADIDVAKVRDFFTGIDSISYEDLGIAERFGGHKLVETDATIGGSLPVNTSGGLKAEGHLANATNIARSAQLRGDAINQVDGARIALAHNIGGPTAVSAVTILEGPGHGGW